MKLYLSKFFKNLTIIIIIIFIFLLTINNHIIFHHRHYFDFPQHHHYLLKLLLQIIFILFKNSLEILFNRRHNRKIILNLNMKFHLLNLKKELMSTFPIFNLIKFNFLNKLIYIYIFLQKINYI